MRIFVTGATGYLGRALVPRLKAEGHEVRALVRASSSTDDLARSGATLFTGDITDRYSLREGMSGADWVIHAAAFVEMDDRRGLMTRVNVDGSENVASLAYKLGVGRFLSVSSIASFGGSPDDGSLANEDSPVRTPYPSLYSETKHLGQQRIREWARQGLRVNTVYPSLIYGPPGKKQGANIVVRSILQGRFPVIVGPEGLASWVYIDDVVEAMVRVIARAPVGRDFILAGEVRTIRDVIATICQLGGVRPPKRAISVATARRLAAIVVPLMRIAGKRPPLTPGQLSSLERHWAFDDSRARTELDWHPRGLEDGLPPTIAMLQARSA